MEKHNGCILADSVGLGKTFTALAVIKYYELRNDRVLVLVPKKLRENWTIYTQNDKRNLFIDDRFNYDVLNNREIRIDDLLGDYPDYLKTLSDYTIKTLKSNMTEEESEILDEMIQRGAGPQEENFKNFTFTDTMINLHFSKYDVLPGVFGEQEVYVPRSIFIKSNLTISSPNKFAKVKFPLEVKGFVEKRTDQTTWVIFEGEAGNIKVINEDGEILGTGILRAEGEWMTDEIVKVSSVISLNNPIKSQNIKLIITENNPDDTRKPYVMILPLIIDNK